MAATVTLSKALEVVEQLAAKDREKLFREMRERRRTAWLARLHADAEQAKKDHRAGKLRTLSGDAEIRAYLDEICRAA